MFKAIKLNNGKYGVKEINDNGDSIRMLEEQFETEHQALDFIAKNGDETPDKEEEEIDDEEGEEGSENDKSPDKEGSDEEPEKPKKKGKKSK